MGRRIEKKSKDGKYTFTAEYVDKDKMPLLDQDRKTIFIRDLPVEQLLNMVRITGCVWCGPPIKALAGKFGDEVWEVAKEAMRKFAYERCKSTLKVANVDLTDARSIGRWMDFEDNIFGIEGEYVETSKKRTVRRQFHCPWAQMIMDIDARGICTHMMMGYMGGVREALIDAGARLKPLPEEAKTRFLTTGYPYCELLWELED